MAAKKTPPAKPKRTYKKRAPLAVTPRDPFRPTIYSEEMVTEICSRVAKGRSIRTICKDEDMPDVTTVFDWIRAKPAFSQRYTEARVEAADAMAEEILDICDDGSNDWMTANVGADNEKVTLNGEHVQRSRLRVDTRKWLMSKLQPKKYGEKLDLNHEGGLTVNIRKLGK